MGLITLGALLASELPAVSPILSPETMLLTTLTVACLGLAVMLLSRPRTQELDPELAIPRDGEFPAASLESTQLLLPGADEPRGASVRALQAEPPQPAVCESPVSEKLAEEVASAPQPLESALADRTDAALDSSLPARAQIPENALDIRTLAPQPLPAACGASALIARAAELLPQVFTPPAGNAARAKSARGPASTQPGSRFSRSQQAFLRIPVVLSGSNESNVKFQEESCTLILLPQGAVIPMKQRVHAGDRLALFNPSRQQEVWCTVFVALQGPDGKMLVEVEFTEQQRNFWPVSFPAWAGNAPGAAAGSNAARTPALDSSGS